LPERQIDKKFLMSIDASINISGRGTVCTGTIEQGQIKLNEDVHLIGIRRRHLPTTVTGIETFHK
jgi:elongation factor Tu